MAGTLSDQDQTPEIKHRYQSFVYDSLRWNFFTFRDDDIVIATVRAATRLVTRV